MSDRLWYKDAIIYQLHVKSFYDANDDGDGDFAGLLQKLDYVESLGVTALWLLPFYPSPLRDDGYDIADYRNINPKFGTLRDFRAFIKEAHRRGLKVITELVINHTSDQHPWFQKARRARPGSAAREFYVWSDTDQRYLETRIIFCDTEKSNWAWDPEAQAYYWHRFYSHQPDLNWDNPRVFDEVTRVMQFWLDMGVDGMRLDAIPYLVEREGTNNENLPETHEVIRRIRAWLDDRYPDRMLLGEANQWPEDVRPYFGEGDECHMSFHFPLMPRLYMAVAREDRHPITDILRQTPEIPDNCQWAIFLRNHDELTLEMVTDRERDYLWNFYAAETRARINLGIRRRLAPLLENDRRKIELLNSVLMSMPGTPVVYYGDEIGMGDNIFLGDRDGVRTPMQWSPDRNAGFSRADPQRLFLPPIMDPVYGYTSVNVEAESRDASSLLQWMRRLIAIRRAHHVFGRGALKILLPGNRKVLAYLRELSAGDGDGDEIVLCVANLSRVPQPVELDLSRYKGRVPVELFGPSPFPPIGDLPYFITLPGYGYYWFRLSDAAAAPSWHQAHQAPMPELLTLVLPHGWRSLLEGRELKTLTAEILPSFLENRRWYAARGVEGEVALGDHAALDDWMLATVQIAGQRYALPLGVAYESRTDDPFERLHACTLARVRSGPRVGVLYDATAEDAFARRLLRIMADGESVPTAGGGRMDGVAVEPLPVEPEARVQRLGAEQSNTSLLVGDRVLLKVYRRLAGGLHPEIEVGRYLSVHAAFPHTPRFLGAIERTEADGTRTAVAIAHAHVQNQGDGWQFTLDHLDRFLDRVEDAGVPAAPEPVDHDFYSALARRLGERVAELHHAFCLGGDPAFDPVPTTRGDLDAWRAAARDQAEQARQALERARADLADDARVPAEDLLSRWPQLLDRIDALAPGGVDAHKTRLHGDLHLGQVLYVKDDWQIIDFEGEPAKPIEQRRGKHSPLRDVAGMLRSFDYAAWSAGLTRTAERAEPLDWLAPRLEAWKRRAVGAFMAGYRARIEGAVSWPADEKTAERLIALFSLEKALYEVVYEATQRPRWLLIPVLGVRRLMESET